jgi:HlyD family secretion protein
MKRVLVILFLIGAAAGGAAYYATHSAADPATVYRVATIRRGDVAPTISATGTLQAEDLIDVGAQVAGLITGFGKDAQGKRIDYNSVVEKDMELAYIDQSSYKAAVEQAEAMLDKAKADLLQYEA